MTTAELIEELRKHPPQKPVRVCLRSVIMTDEMGLWLQALSEEDANDADEVRNEGGFVLIWGGRP
jgi:hypothetical protein